MEYEAINKNKICDAGGFGVGGNLGKGPLQTRVIAQNQDISVKYLEQLMAALKSAGLIRSQAGEKGGYILANPPKRLN